MTVEVKPFFSTAIEQATFDDESNELVVTFTDGSEAYLEDFDPGLWAEFKDAPSAGRFWNQRIKGLF